jgi:rare lipoprotein A
MDGHDMPYLMASYVPKGSRIPGVNPEGQIASGVMVASNSRKITRDQLQSAEDYEARPAKVPVPMSATSYAGSTPSARYNAAPALAPGAHVLVAPTAPSANAAPAFDQMVVLPEIGPMPYERPYGGSQPSLALGYQNEGVKTVTVDLAFDAVMVRNDGLTQASILASAKRQQAKSAAR